MLFLIRSAFWLTIVFASMSWPDDVPQQISSAATNLPKTQEILTRTLVNARAGIGKACFEAPAACLEAAARLSQIAGDKREGPLKAPLDRLEHVR
ncbi:hypothetical protein [Methylocapsa aurea]|uniref:hypothetical protein n=1 Tax=Methylocapsa aurea TaxID=663610 RepID=UPI00055F8A80|nr:hypothetical protein [Methylocapsa aurea]